MISHYVLTRFNVTHAELEGDSGKQALNEQWLHRRFDLFAKICAPSVIAQTRTDFEWLVFVRPDTPPDLMALIKARVADSGGRTVPSFAGDGVDALRAIGRPKSNVLITTRLDSDDALSKDFIERVRTVRIRDFPSVINFTIGCQLDRNGCTQLVRHPDSPFLSYVEKNGGDEDMRTCWGFNHRKPPPDACLIRKRGRPAWLQGIHELNIANPPRLGPQMAKATVVKHFSIHPGLVEERGTASRLLRLARDGSIVAGRRVRWTVEKFIT